MKFKFTLVLPFAFLLFIETNAQATSMSSTSGGRPITVFMPRDLSNNSKEFEKIAHKMYLTPNYMPCKVDGLNEIMSLKFNIYRNEMELIKNDKIAILKKQKGKKVKMLGIEKTYQVFEHNGKLKYFVLHNLSGEAKLLSEEIVKYYKATEPKSNYDSAKPENFKRQNDEIFIKFKDNSFIEVPKSKKKFPLIFGEKASEIKSFMKKGKLKSNNIKDLTKIINYYNTL
ncbi:hypothetical protein [uncultured Polaribacter sp.]|uniref:hypothetical protein n=1 Tax=uncultured Polaribacter sp. TaxID=174711 RepID=UPI002623AD5A|nr:hypothetical protein [uncultured Polaribacter sp.]